VKRILLVEDDLSLAKDLNDYLTQESYMVQVVRSVKEAQIISLNFDLIILDWMLSDGQGIDLLKQIRADKNWIPVIFLTAKADLIDRVVGLESGANDYIVKPFEPRELLARLRVHLRQPTVTMQVLRHGDIILDLDLRSTHLKNKLIETTKKEFDLLALLFANPKRVFSRDELLNKVWGFENFPTTRTVDTHVLQLRQKLGDDLIQTVRGVGYRLKIDQELTSP
jgi:DNA-binding response OmpR family regulator